MYPNVISRFLFINVSSYNINFHLFRKMKLRTMKQLNPKNVTLCSQRSLPPYVWFHRMAGLHALSVVSPLRPNAMHCARSDTLFLVVDRISAHMPTIPRSIKIIASSTAGGQRPMVRSKSEADFVGRAARDVPCISPPPRDLYARGVRFIELVDHRLRTPAYRSEK